QPRVGCRRPLSVRRHRQPLRNPLTANRSPPPAATEDVTPSIIISAMRQAWAVLLAGLCVIGVTLTAQGARTFKARLSPVPIDLAMQATIAGSGTATATLNGTKLTIAGTFEGLKSSATIAKVHKSPVRGVRGPEILDLTITTGQGATSGTISGTFDL